MLFIDKDGNYPKYLADLQEAYPLWTFKQALPHGWNLVKETLPPEISSNQMLVEEFPVQVNGSFIQNWSIIDISEQIGESLKLDGAYLKVNQDK